MISTVLIAYIGPGAGVSLIWALIGLLLAIASALLFVVAWPIRMMRRRMESKLSQAADGDTGDRDVPL